MKLSSLLLVLYTIIILSGSTFADNELSVLTVPGDSSTAKIVTHKEIGQSTLAVLVKCKPAGKDLADKLEFLLETEFSLQWTGLLAERTKIDKL